MKWLGSEIAFPSVDTASPQGIVAVGGDYQWQRILAAYRQGIFPWCSPEDPILWWSPDPRYVLYPDQLKVQKSMRPLINQRRFRVTYDTCFKQVISLCGEVPRGGKEVGTWISADLVEGYTALHQQGYAHSVEVWDDHHQLVGGLYGVAIGNVFCGESMFALVPNASKYGFIHLVRNLRRLGYWLIDCQLPTQHLISFGAEAISRREYIRTLQLNSSESDTFIDWNQLMLDEALNDKV